MSELGEGREAVVRTGEGAVRTELVELLLQRSVLLLLLCLSDGRLDLPAQQSGGRHEGGGGGDVRRRPRKDQDEGLSGRPSGVEERAAILHARTRSLSACRCQ